MQASLDQLGLPLVFRWGLPFLGVRPPLQAYIALLSLGTPGLALWKDTSVFRVSTFIYCIRLALLDGDADVGGCGAASRI